MVKISFEAGKKDLIWIGLVVLVLGFGVVYAYGGNNPAVMGHSAAEILVNNNLCNQITGHDCGTDNVGAVGVAGAKAVVAGGVCLNGFPNLWQAEEHVYGGASCTGMGSLGVLNCPTGSVKWITMRLVNSGLGGQGGICVKNFS